MNKKWMKFSSVALLSLYLAACDTTEEAAEEPVTEVVEEEETTDAEEDNETAEDHDEHEDHDDEDHADHSEQETDSEQAVVIEGAAEHYHTGELVELTANITEETEYEDWHWYMRSDEEAEWEMIPDQNSNEFISEAPEESVEIRAVLYDNEHNPFAESAPMELEVDNH